MSDPLDLVNSVKAMRIKTEAMKNLADDLGKWVDRLNTLNDPKTYVDSVEFNKLNPIGMAWMNGNPLFEHDLQMIKDAMISICTVQIESGYKRMQTLKEDL